MSFINYQNVNPKLTFLVKMLSLKSQANTPVMKCAWLLRKWILQNPRVVIEGVKNTRKGSLNCVFKTKNFFPLCFNENFSFLLIINTTQEVE